MSSDTQLLCDLAATINAAHVEAITYAGKAVARALDAGDLLLQAKASLPHGEFGAWCGLHLPAISQRTVQRYMRAARQTPVEIRHVSHLTVDAAAWLATDQPDSGSISGDILVMLNLAEQIIKHLRNSRKNSRLLVDHAHVQSMQYLYDLLVERVKCFDLDRFDNLTVPPGTVYGDRLEVFDVERSLDQFNKKIGSIMTLSRQCFDKVERLQFATSPQPEQNP